MSGARVEIVRPRDGLIEAVASGLAASGRDYSRHWIVFPERRPAAYLRKRLARSAGGAFRPPRIDSLDAFVDRLHAEALGRRSRPLDALDAVAVLFEIHRSAPNRLGEDRYLRADQFFPLGLKLYADLEELAAAGAEGDDLLRIETWAEEDVPARTRDRLQRLSYFYEAFYEALDRRGGSTPASRLRDVARGVEPRHFAGLDRVVAAGFFSGTKMEAALLRTLLRTENAALYFLRGRGLGEALARLGLDDPAILAAAEAPDPEPGPEIEFTASPDTHGQVFALNAALAGAGGRTGGFEERQVVVLPAAETLFPLFQQTLAPLGQEGFNISLGYPLSRTPLAAFFERLFELLQSTDEEGRVYAPHYLRFVLHPYAKNLYFPGREKRADLTRILFHAVEDELLRRRTRAFWHPDEIAADAGVRRSIRDLTAGLEGAPDPGALLDHLRAIHAVALEPFRKIRDAADFARKLAALLDHVYENSTARLHLFFHPYAEAFMDRLQRLAASLLGGLRFEDATGYANLFRAVVAGGTVPFFGTPLRGLQVLGFWETRGIRFDDVWLLDLNEDLVPPARRLDSILPAAARRALGLPTSRDLERRMDHALDGLLRGARRARIFYADNEERERSRFVERLIWERQVRDGIRDGESLVRTVSYKVDLRAAGPRPRPKSPDVAAFLRRFVYSATALDAYLSCPLKFYHGYILGLREREEAGEATDRRDLGIFVHGVLEEYFGRFAGRPLRASDLREADLTAVVERRFAEAFGPGAGGPAYLAKVQTARHLAEFLSLHQRPLVAALDAGGRPLVIEALERKLTVERAVAPPGEAPGGERVFKLTAKIDRIERRGEDLFVLDYKTSHDDRSLRIDFPRLAARIAELDRLPPGAEGPARNGLYVRALREASGSLQIPIYTLVLAAERGLEPGAVNGRFLMLGRGRLGPGIEISPFEAATRKSPLGPGEREARIALTGRLLDRLLLEISDPGVPFAPVEAAGDSCRLCPFTAFCGRL